MSKIRFAFGLAALAAIGMPAQAEPEAPSGALVLRMADADRSGDVTAEEWQAFLDGLTVDENGAVDLAALVEMLPPRHARHMNRHGGGDGGERPTPEEVLQRVLDSDGDGVVTVSDLQAIFDGFDEDADGAIADDEKPARPRRMGRRARRAGKTILRAADTDESGDVTAEEWEAFKDALGADEDGVFAVQALIALLPEPPEDVEVDEEKLASKLTRVLDRDRDEALELSDLDAIFDHFDRDDDGILSEDELSRRRRRRR